MTAPLTYVDPALTAFFAQGQLPATFDPLPPQQDHAAHDAALALELAAAFLVCAHLVRNHLRNREPGADPNKLVRQFWQHDALPVWVSLAGTAIRKSIESTPALPVIDATTVARVATGYAASVGDYLGETSIEAYTGAIDAQLASKWSEAAAVARAAAGFGLDKVAFGAFLRVASKDDEPELVSPAAQAVADEALVVRAALVGDSEAHTSIQTAKALSWMQMQAMGLLPADARRRWVGGDDCAVCGPLDGDEVELSEPFQLGELSLWTPQAHPHCRCHVELVDAEGGLIAKAFDARKHPRGQGGRWGVVAEAPERNAAVDAMMAEAAAQTETEAPVDPFARTGPARDPFAARGGADSFAADPFKRTVAAVDPFAQRGNFDRRPSAVFAALPSDAFRAQPRPVRRVNRRVSLIVNPPPPMAKDEGIPTYFMPADTYHERVSEHDVHTTMPNNMPVDFDWPLASGEAPLLARATGEPWGALSYDQLANGRVGVKRVKQHLSGDHFKETYEPRMSQQEVSDWWHEKWLPLADEGWDEAIDQSGWQDVDPEHGGTGDGIVAQLDSDDLMTIAYNAGERYGDDEELREMIVAACAKLGSGNDSLAAAYADYVVYVKPEKISGSLGQRMSNELHDVRERGLNMTHRLVDQVLAFGQGLHYGTAADSADAEMRGKYLINNITYRSAIHDNGYGAAPLAVGMQEASAQPFVERSTPFR